MPAKRSKVAKAARTSQPKVQLGDRVTIPNSPLVWTILRIRSNGLANLTFEDTNLQRFRLGRYDADPSEAAGCEREHRGA